MKDNHYGPQLWCIYTALLIIASCQINGCINDNMSILRLLDALEKIAAKP